MRLTVRTVHILQQSHPGSRDLGGNSTWQALQDAKTKQAFAVHLKHVSKAERQKAD